jgi:hypothetical protein
MQEMGLAKNRPNPEYYCHPDGSISPFRPGRYY